jgi:tRNA dimethylallyltransferase
MQATRGKIIAVLGPTCTGKSDLGLQIAQVLHGEIVNADSMQVYRHFDIGSAKPSREVRAAVPHHLIDVVDPDNEFNAALFQKAADDAIGGIIGRGRVPVVVGGTGLYLRVLFHGLFQAAGDAAVRAQIKERYAGAPLETYEELKRVDPEYALRISHRDGVRVVRALEIYYVSGSTMSEWQRRHGFEEERYAACKIGLRRDREELYRRINARVDAMLQQGWVQEVERLLQAGYSPELKPFKSIGYREIVLYVQGKMTHSAMVEKVRTSTRHYAKRQFTWFLRENDIEWYGYPEEKDHILKGVAEFLR